MNIDSIINRIELFEGLVINSGFRRDISDFHQSIQHPQNQNLTFMKGISETIQTSFKRFDNNSLNSELDSVLRDSAPFTAQGTSDVLQNLDNNESIEPPAYFQELDGILGNLASFIDANISEINAVRRVFEKYVSKQIDFKAENKQALMSLVFKDDKSTGELKEFSRVLGRWNYTLRMLHELVKSESPKDISLVQIQNGSIDIIFTIDFDVAIILTKLTKAGLSAYAAYLTYKLALAKEIMGSYLGHIELIEMEEKREKLMLENIKSSVERMVMEIHENCLQKDQTISTESVEIKIQTISKTITDHTIKGNEIKLLTASQHENEQDGETEEKNLSRDLREKTALVRERYKKLPPEDKQFLLEMCSIKDSETENDND